jgi:hypothetical protein
MWRKVIILATAPSCGPPAHRCTAWTWRSEPASGNGCRPRRKRRRLPSSAQIGSRTSTRLRWSKTTHYGFLWPAASKPQPRPSPGARSASSFVRGPVLGCCPVGVRLAPMEAFGFLWICGGRWQAAIVNAEKSQPKRRSSAATKALTRVLLSSNAGVPWPVMEVPAFVARQRD